MNAIIENIEKSFLKKSLPNFRIGDMLRVDVKIVEGESERLQAFEGVVISKRGHGIGATFTLRKISFGVGVERTFPLHSPRLENIKIMRSGKVRRAKLYYLRNLTGEAARIEEQEEVENKTASKSEPAPAPAEQKAASPTPVGATTAR